MCKTLWTYEWFEFLIIFLCRSYRYITYMHSHSNLCHSNVSSTYYVSKIYLNNLTFNIPKIDFSNPAKLYGFGGIFAGARFLPDLEKVPDSGRSRSRNRAQPCGCLFQFVLALGRRVVCDWQTRSRMSRTRTSAAWTSRSRKSVRRLNCRWLTLSCTNRSVSTLLAACWCLDRPGVARRCLPRPSLTTLPVRRHLTDCRV